MIPYFELHVIRIGGVSIAAFGLLVAIGVGVGVWFAQHRARVLGVPEGEMNAVIAWTLVGGFAFSHVLALLSADPSDTDPWRWLAFWNGMSSFGGFAGALLGLLAYFAIRGRASLVVAEIVIQAVTLGWLFGRLGCTLVHDHVGRLSRFPLAIRFPGGARHDLGFYEFLYTLLVLAPAIVWLNRRPRRPGATACVIPLLYAPARFLGDFLRRDDLPGADLRYHGLTAAQYGCIALLGVGLYLARRLWRANA